MEYVDIKNGNYTKDSITKIAKSIKAGEVLVLPTDTVYGIVSDAFNGEAVRKIYELKNREYSNPMSVVVSNIEMVKKVAKNISETEKKIIEKFLPGALTIIFEKSNMIPDIVTSGLNTIRSENAR